MNAGNKQIQIHRMIIHKIDHQNYKTPQYADLDSPLTDEVRQFLIDHIERNQNHKYARSGVFLEKFDGAFSLRDCCEEMVANPNTFVDNSRALADHLFQSIDHRVSTGDLVVCLFSDGADNLMSIARILSITVRLRGDTLAEIWYTPWYADPRYQPGCPSRSGNAPDRGAAAQPH